VSTDFGQPSSQHRFARLPSVSEFVLESALARAEEAVPDRQRFGFNAERWAFLAALDAAPRPLPRLKRKAFYERFDFIASPSDPYHRFLLSFALVYARRSLVEPCTGIPAGPHPSRSCKCQPWQPRRHGDLR
jgi:hypothetical protein